MSGNKNKNKHSYIQTYSSNNNFKTNSRFTRSKKLPQRLWMHYMPMNAEQTHLEAFLSFPTLHTFFYHWKHHNYRFRHNHSHGTTSHWEDNLIISTLSLFLSLLQLRDILCASMQILFITTRVIWIPQSPTFIFMWYEPLVTLQWCLP